MKQKIAGIFLLICVVVPVTTTYLFLQFQKKQVKREVKWKMIAGIEKEALVLLKFTASEVESQVKWEHSKEFEFKGEMFDVVEKRIKGDTIYYWCWSDREETKLNRQLDELVSCALGLCPERQEIQKQTIDFYKQLFHELHQDQFADNVVMKSDEFNCIDDLKQVYLTPSLPPPRIG